MLPLALQMLPSAQEGLLQGPSGGLLIHIIQVSAQMLSSQGTDGTSPSNFWTCLTLPQLLLLLKIM